MGNDAASVTVGVPVGRPAVDRRLSVWHFLVVIALLPTLLLPLLAGMLARARLTEASTASRLEGDLLAIASMDRLREALTAEAIAGPLTMIAQQTGLSLTMISGQIGKPIASLDEARATSDRAFASVPRIAEFDVALPELKARLPTLRAAFDASMAAPGGGLASLGSISADYGRLADLASTAEQTLAHRLGRGVRGIGSPRLLARIRSFEAVSVVVASQARRTGVFFYGLLVGSPSQAAREEFAAESKRYEVLRAQLDTELDPQAAPAWHRMISAEEFRLVDAAMANGAPALPGVSTLLNGGQLDLSAVLQVLPTARSAMAVVSQLSAFLQQTAHDTAALARIESAGARRYAVVFLCGTGLAIVITIVALFVIGGVLRDRLSRLAEAAQRLSAGYLEPTAVRGPREVAALSEALNAAVTTLQHVQAKAELLASGDLDSPELEEPAPGPLGAAVHASVSRIVTAAREREELQLQLAHDAAHDALTGLPNRAELDRALRAALARAQRDDTAVSVMFIDLDGFKRCNDRFGHGAGDHVLRVSAQRLRDGVRPGDVVGRLGGDEFIVIVEAALPGPDTVQLGERIVAALSAPIACDGKTVTIGASIGLAGCDRGRATADQLLSAADAAVYHAKAAGRGCVKVHDGTSHVAAQA